MLFRMIQSKDKAGFTLIELGIVLVVIGVIASITIIALNTVGTKNRDTKRIGDIRAVQTALELYYNRNGAYPDTLTAGVPLSFGGKTYLDKVPSAPGHPDGACTTDTYSYALVGGSYTLDYCLGGTIQGMGPGKLVAIPGQIGAQASATNLTNLTFSETVANYNFSAGTYIYNGLSVLNAVSSITVTPTGVGDITVDGTPVASGQASGVITLDLGVEKTISVMVAEAGTVSRTYTLKVTRQDVQATPTFDPVAGTIAFGSTVAITSAGADAIYYTTDGTDPTTASTPYAVPFVTNPPITFKALAVKAGKLDSAIGSVTYSEPCIPACAGKICGDDGCGGICAPNSCSGGTPACSPDGTTCIAVADCASAVCGDGTGLNCGASDFVANGSLTLNSDNASAYQSTITYQAIKIGTQCWLDKNINIGTMDTGHTMITTNASTGIKRYCYSDTMTNCDDSPYDGGLYTWAMAAYLPSACNTSITANCAPSAYVTGSLASAKRQGICPKGWHLPSDYEWWYLEDYAQRIATPAGSALASDNPDYYTDQIGIAGTAGHRGTSEEKLRSPAGSTNLKFTFAGRYVSAFSGRVDEAFIWTSTQSQNTTSWYRYLYRGYAPPRRDKPIKTVSQSVRCLKN